MNRHAGPSTVEIVHTGGDRVILFTDPQAAPLPLLEVPQPTEPMHRGMSFSAPAPRSGRPNRTRRPLWARFADCRIASAAMTITLCVAIASVLIVVYIQP